MIKTTKIISITIVILLLITPQVFAKKLASLPEVQRPYRLGIKNNTLIISDEKTLLHMYSLDDFSYKLLSKRGEGPSESKIPLKFWLYKDKIFAIGIRKGMCFSYDGKYLDELRIMVPELHRACPLEENFVVSTYGRAKKQTQSVKELSIYEFNKKEKTFRFKKLIYYYSREYTISKGKLDYAFIKDYYGFIVEDGLVFVADTYRGFSVDIYDSQGNEAGKIRLYPEQIKIPDAFKKKSFKEMEKNPAYKVWKATHNPYFPKYYPDFYRFGVDNGKVYFLTYKKIDDDKREVIVTDYHGKILKRGTIPWIENYRIYTNFAIENDKYYYIKENEDAEEWELHVEAIK